MKHTVIEILFTLLNLSPIERLDLDICKLNRFANIIQSTSHLEGKGDEDIENLLSILSDLSQLYVKPKESKYSSCGVFQAVPKFTLLKLSCDDLHDPILATKEALMRLHSLKRKFFNGGLYDGKGNIAENKQIELALIYLMGGHNHCNKPSSSCDRHKKQIALRLRELKKSSKSDSEQTKKRKEEIKNKISQCL